ncbi:hypothetical protein BFJ63_vAg17836 [Fusarium oxysporum f. sp. narcissi]|uniref:Transcription factor domain-containing protein n=1 Tax=Fusarium oxysporum f. sp. narcissi TaxID=451672 RepID=A0A4Q2V4Q7_FUSOX|nr:hypothetical protein BFJ63_vAg17836 [Fusarium oxysporum f. sp. narcissi]
MQPRLPTFRRRECCFAGTAKSTRDNNEDNNAGDDGLDQAGGQEEERLGDGNVGGESSPSMLRTSNHIQESPIAIAVDANTSYVGLNNSSQSQIYRPDEVDSWGHYNQTPPDPQTSLSLSSLDPSANVSTEGMLSHPSNMEGLYYHTPRQSSPSANLSIDVPRDLDWWLDPVPFDDNIFDLFPFIDNYSVQSGLSIDASACPQQPSAHHQPPLFDPHQFPSAFSQQSRLPAIAAALFPRLDHDASRWLVTRPSISNFDRTIVNRFLNLFFAQASSTFTSFKSFRITCSTNEEEVLAIAAFGGLYCTTRGSHVIARALCSDARRLLLTRIRADLPVEVERKTSLLRTVSSSIIILRHC